MKGGVFLAFIVMFSCVVLAAGEMKTLDFSNSTSLLVQIGVDDGVRFDWGGKNHQVVVRSVSPAEQRVEITTFIEGAPTPSYASIHPETSVVLDFDRDDKQDMKVSLVKFVDMDSVILLFEKLSEPTSIPPVVEKSWFNRVFSRPFGNVFYNLGLLVVIVIVIVLLFSSRFVRRKYRRFRRSMRID